MSEDSPGQDYYPSAKIRLTVRLDEFGDDSRLRPLVPQGMAKNIGLSPTPRQPLVPQPDPDGSGRIVLLPKGGAVAQGPPTESSSSPDGLSFDFTILPKDASWSQNGIRTADTLHTSFKFIDCPIDPRCVRSAAVEFFLGTVSEADHAGGIAGLRRSSDTSGQGSTGEALHLVPDEYRGPRGESRTNSRFKGFVDKWVVDWGDNAEPVVHLECSDLTSLLIDTEMPAAAFVSQALPIDQAIAKFLAEFPTLQGMSVQYRPKGAKPPTVGDAFGPVAMRPNLGPPMSKGGGAAGGKHSIWDYLTDVCGALGHVIYVDGTSVVISHARTYTSGGGAGTRREEDPFQGRDLPSGRADVRRFIYGRNLLDMKVSREYRKHPPKNIEVRAYDPANKKTIVARFPLPADRQIYAIPGGAKPDQKWTVIRVSGIKDDKTLRAVAQSYYEQQGRNEVSCSLKTKNLATFGGGNADPDLLDMKPGDAFELLVNRDSDYNALTGIEKALLVAGGTDLLRSLGFTDAFARAYAKAYNDGGFLTVYRAKTMKVHWSIDSGVAFDVNGVNYVAVRADKLLPQAEEPTNPDLQVTTKPNRSVGIV